MAAPVVLPRPPHAIQSKIAAGLAAAHVVLTNERDRALERAGSTPHSYSDKFTLCEQLVHCVIRSSFNGLELLGWTHSSSLSLGESNDSISLRCSIERGCSLIDTVQERDQVSDSLIVKRTRYNRRLRERVRLLLFRGPAPDHRSAVLFDECVEHDTHSYDDRVPHPELELLPDIDVNVSWLFSRVASWSEGRPTIDFRIDRANAACRTPRRNPEVARALKQMHSLAVWYSNVEDAVRRTWQRRMSVPQLNLTVDSSSLVQALFQRFAASPELPTNTAVELATDSLPLLLERDAETQRFLASLSPASSPSPVHARLVIACLYGKRVLDDFQAAADSIEAMLRRQMASAVGKELTNRDFDDFMDFYYAKVFRQAYRPRPFDHAVRVGQHSAPEGSVAIESSLQGATRKIFTLCRSFSTAQPMRMDLDAATSVAFTGSYQLHSFMSHSFSTDSRKLTLVARARQFSSYVLLAGKIISSSQFEPEIATVVRNGDRALFDLLLEVIPSKKEFREQIQSISQQQQDFAKAYRAMKLQSTLFGLCVVPIRPQFERLLALPAGSLLKELDLRDKIADLLCNYGIPSDLLKYDERSDASDAEKVAFVAKCTQQQCDMIHAMKMELLRPPPPPPPRPVPQFQGGRGDLLSMIRSGAKLKCVEPSAPPPPSSSSSANPHLLASILATSLACRRSAVPSSSGGWDDDDDFGLDDWSDEPHDSLITNCPPPPPPPPPSTSAPPPPPPPPAGGAPPPPSGSPAAAPSAELPPTPSSSPNNLTPDQPPSEIPIVKAKRKNEGASSKMTQLDVTDFPRLLEKKFDSPVLQSVVRPTIISVAKTWKRERSASLLSRPVLSGLNEQQSTEEKKQAFDLLEVLSRGGSLPLEDCSFHVVVPLTHCFESSLVNTLIQDNVDPIEKLTESLLLVAETTHGEPAVALARIVMK